MKKAAIIQKKVLVIDDNPSMLLVMKRALEIKEYDVYTSETFAGVENIAEIAPDIIYMDVSLGQYDGREAARALKKSDTTKHICIIMLTGHADVEDLTKEAGADGHLSKPFELEKLWRMTEKYTS